MSFRVTRLIIPNFFFFVNPFSMFFENIFGVSFNFLKYDRRRKESSYLFFTRQVRLRLLRKVALSDGLFRIPLSIAQKRN